MKDGTWVQIHDQLREWTRIEQERQPSPYFSEESGLSIPHSEKITHEQLKL